DRADVEITIWPSVHALADARRKRVVDGGVAKRAGHAEPGERIAAVDCADRSLESDHRIQFEERDGCCGTLEIDLAGLDRRGDVGWNRLGVHLQADRQRGCRVDGFLYDLVHARTIGPEFLVAEGLEPENILAGGETLRCGCGGDV